MINHEHIGGGKHSNNLKIKKKKKNGNRAKLIIFPNFSSVILSSENLPGIMLLLVGEGADV